MKLQSKMKNKKTNENILSCTIPHKTKILSIETKLLLNKISN